MGTIQGGGVYFVQLEPDNQKNSRKYGILSESEQAYSTLVMVFLAAVEVHTLIIQYSGVANSCVDH